jgi:sec-independent protein translocase protein TatB
MSFFELLVIAVVGLLVIGPERLPETIRTGMLWLGRIKRTINDTKQEFEQQLGVDEIRRELHNEQIMASLKAVEDAQNQTADALNPIDEALKNQIKEIENSIDDPVPHDDDPNAPETQHVSGSSPEKPEVQNEAK